MILHLIPSLDIVAWATMLLFTKKDYKNVTFAFIYMYTHFTVHTEWESRTLKVLEKQKMFLFI